MPFFNFSTYRRPTKGTGGIKPYGLAVDKLDLLDLKYADLLSGEINDPAYFDEALSVLWAAFDDPSLTASQRGDVKTKIGQIQKAQAKWNVTNHPLFDTTITGMKNEMKANWADVWSEKNVLASGNVELMIEAMQQIATGTRDELTDYLEGLKEITTDEKRITTLEEALNFAIEQETFWRGVETSPEEYALGVEADAKGNVIDISIHNLITGNSIGETKLASLKNANQTIGETGTFAGLKLYGKPHPALTDDDGTEHFNIGGNIFSGSDGDFEFDSEAENGKSELDLSGLSRIPFGNYAPGSLLESSSGSVYAVSDTGEYLKISNPDYLKQLDLTNNDRYQITDDEEQKLNSQYKIREIGKSAIRAYNEIGLPDPQAFVNESRQQVPSALEILNNRDPQLRGEVFRETGKTIGRGFKLFGDIPGSLENIAGEVEKRPALKRTVSDLGKSPFELPKLAVKGATQLTKQSAAKAVEGGKQLVRGVGDFFKGIAGQ